jgi:hypothetical protein
MLIGSYTTLSTDLIEKPGFRQAMEKVGQADDIEAAASLFGAS